MIILKAEGELMSDSVVKESLTITGGGKNYEQMKLDFEKHNQQYEPISYVQLPHAVHDRYLIVDDDVWLLGSSVKDMGRSLCSIIKVGFTPEEVIEKLK